MSASEKVALFELHNLLVEILIYPKDTKDAECIEVHKEMEGKTPGQRLRAVLFVLWKKKGQPEMFTFESFYSTQMEKIIEWVKQKIDAK